jgi:phage/plasmid-associated DNA primase
VPQERIYSLQGSQASGKGTLLYSIANALGDYSVAGYKDTLSGNGGLGNGRTDFSLIRLRASRFAYFDEFGGGLLGDKAKTLSQAGIIQGEAKFQDAIEFPITWSLWLSSNTRPRIDYTDKGICRRIVEVPMNSGSKTPDDPDYHIKHTLMHDVSARAATLAIMVKALARASELDFQPPLGEEIQKATDEWKQSSDMIAAWADKYVTNMDGNPTYKIESAYSKYLADMADMFPGASRREVPLANKHQFASAMRDRGYKLRNSRYYGCQYRPGAGLDGEPTEPKLP